MAKPVLILLHGMGVHTPQNFEKEVTAALNKAIGTYPSNKTEKITDWVDIVPIDYDDIFETHRKKLAETSKNFHTVLSGIENQNNVAELATKLTKATSYLNDDGFFYTHILDVIFYVLTELGELVRLRVGKIITEQIAKVGASNVHILAHSLGTSVLHDTLVSMYTKDYFLGETKEALSADIHKLGSIHMVANVSRLLETFEHVENSIVNPGTGGCTSFFNEYRHKFDLFTKPRAFNPDESEPWVEDKYKLTRVKRFYQANAHDITHYLVNPLVHLKLFSYLNIDFMPSKTDRETADAAYELTTTKGKAQEVEEKLKKIRINDVDSIIEFINTAKGYKAHVESYRETF